MMFSEQFPSLLCVFPQRLVLLCAVLDRNRDQMKSGGKLSCFGTLPNIISKGETLWMSVQLFYKQKGLRENEVPSQLLLVCRIIKAAIMSD